MKNKFKVFPSMTAAVFLAMTIAMFAFTRAASSSARVSQNSELPAPIPQSTDGNQTFLFDSGVITIGGDQTLRITFSAGGDSGSLIVSNDSFMQLGCAGAVCKHTVASHANLGPFRLTLGEALSIDVAANGGSGMRQTVRSNIKNLRVVGEIIDSQGNLVTSFLFAESSSSTIGNPIGG